MNAEKAKVTIVGAGAIGSTVAYGMLLRKSASNIVLVNRHAEKAEIKAFDMSHCMPSIDGASISGGGLEASAGSQVIILTVGILPKKDGNRADVLIQNLDIYRDLVPYLAELSPKAVVVTVTNPVDLMALAAHSFSGFPEYRVLGTGTLLDTLRFKSFIGEALGVPSSEIEALIVGEHGESMVPIWSRTSVNGIGLSKYVKDNGICWDKSVEEVIMKRTRRAGWDIRLGNEHSCYAIAFSTALIVERILRGNKDFLPVSVQVNGESLGEEIFMSWPSKLGLNGVLEMEALNLNGKEREMVEYSKEIIKRSAMQIREHF